MDWRHPKHAHRKLKLAYCLNLHAAEDLAGLYAGLERITLPLRERLQVTRSFGVGLWLPAPIALQLSNPAGRAELERLRDYCRDAGLEAFTFNAFPYAGFQRAGLKADVYRPTWWEPERLEYSLAVAHIAAALNSPAAEAHLSISTHPGSYGAWMSSAEQHLQCARLLARAVAQFAQIEADVGQRLILALEAEPLASAGDTRELAGFLAYARTEIAAELRKLRGFTLAQGEALAQRHLGTCLDTCHAAVEFEEPLLALARSSYGGPLGKLQFSSALALEAPRTKAEARAHLFALAEPRFLHQVVGQHGPNLLHAADLPDLERALAQPASPWWDCSAWRCHFHVPVDLPEVEGLGTTRMQADETLAALLQAPEDWSTKELHVEIETYTWDVLPRTARGAGELILGLEREYRHVMALLSAHGWRPA